MLFFIVNAMSHTGKGMLLWEQLEDLLQDNKIDYDCSVLEKGDSLADMVREVYYTVHPSTLVIVGGDGTIGTVLTALPSFENMTIAVVPAGSGNDFARAMRLPDDPNAIVDMLLDSDRVTTVNVGQMTLDDTRRCFAVSSGMGFDAAVCALAGESNMKKHFGKLSLGHLSYLAGALRLLKKKDSFSLRVILDDAQLITYDDVLFAAVMNTKYEGGGFMFTPHAKYNDDELDLIVVAGVKTSEILRLLPAAMKGKHTSHPGVHIIRCRKAILQADHPVEIHTDGEVWGQHTKVTYSLNRQNILLRLPKKKESSVKAKS